MELKLIGIEDAYECENLVRIFFPGVDLKLQEKDFVRIEKCENGVSIEIEALGKRLCKTEKKALMDEWELLTFLYDALSEITSHKPPWGMLTGVRPVKLALDMLKESHSEAWAENVFTNKFKVSPPKTALAVKTAKVQQKILLPDDEKSVSIYAGIPFCPTRCKYCSFVCEGIERHRDLVPKYLQCLLRELDATAEIVSRQGLKVKTVYVGGGTPTSLNEEELFQLVKRLSDNFVSEGCSEFTVEAGRPDTVTEGKLDVLRQNGVGRISINPQTLNDEVLKNIGRDHTADDFRESFKKASQMKCFDINVDLIAGLPGDDSASFEKTVREIVSLDPANITLHTLTLKRSANIYRSKELYDEADRVKEDVALGNSIFEENGYFPYYLYRQKNTVGGLENTGFSKKGKEGLYNIFIMDESHSILACGAGASSKAVGGRNKIVRSFNYKYPKEYIDGFQDILERKKNFEKELISSLQER